MVAERYLRERGDWIAEPCEKCGLDELFDAPSDLARATFPNAPPDAVLEKFSTLLRILWWSPAR